MEKTNPKTKGQTMNTALVGIAILTAVGTKAVDWMANRFLDSPDVAAKEISLVKAQLADANTRIDKVCTYTINQADRMDKNLQAIAKALKVDVTTGNDKDNPCTK